MCKSEFLKSSVLLYVEDESLTLQTFKALFETLLKRVYIASDGVEGFEIFKANQDEIDLVITDLHMPFLSGFEMIKLIKKLKDIPIIVTTSFPNEVESSQLVDIVLEKPISKEKIFEALDVLKSKK